MVFWYIIIINDINPKKYYDNKIICIIFSLVICALISFILYDTRDIQRFKPYLPFAKQKFEKFFEQITHTRTRIV